MNNARVKITLPMMQDVWFFLQQDTTVANLRKMVQDEDSSAEIFQVLQRPTRSKEMPTPLEDGEVVYDHIQKTSIELILQLNDNFFELMTATPVPLSIEYSNPYLQKCEEAGIKSELHKSSINAMIAQINCNIEFSEEGTVSSKEVRNQFVQQLDFFNDPVIREEVFRL